MQRLSVAVVAKPAPQSCLGFEGADIRDSKRDHPAILALKSGPVAEQEYSGQHPPRVRLKP